MKKKLLFFATILLIGVRYQQATAQSSTFVGNEGTLRFFELYDSEGKPIKTASEMGVAGSPMLFEGWASGVVHYKNGVVFADTAMNYSLFDNQLFYVRDHRMFKIVLPVASFYLSYMDKGEAVNYHFKSGYPAVDGRDTMSLYEVLYEGDNLQLVQWTHKKVKESFGYGNVHEKSFAPEKILYVYLPKEHTMTELRPAIAVIKKRLPAYADIISDYCSKNKINIKDEEQVTALFAYLDKRQ
jgi:hypothetical protein